MVIRLTAVTAICVLWAGLCSHIQGAPTSASAGPHASRSKALSLSKAVKDLGRKYKMDLTLQDNRSSPTTQPATARFRPTGQGFWADLRRLEQAFGVGLAWQGEVKGQYILVVGDGDLGIDLGQVSGRWRVVVSRYPLAVFWPQSSHWPEDRRYLTLQYLPGPTVIAARWTPPQGLVGAEMALGAPGSTAADLGRIPAKMVSRFGGQMEIVTAKAWKEVSIPLKTDAKVTPGAQSGIEQIRVLRYGATDFDLEPNGYHILPAGAEGANSPLK